MKIFTDEQRRDLLVTALEGGSNYWYFLPSLEMVKHQPGEATVEAIFRMVNEEGYQIPVNDLEERDDVLGWIDKRSMDAAEVMMMEESRWAVAQELAGDGDAITADVWFQYVVMGEIVFG